MEPTSQFFSKLRKLAVTLESETSRLQRAFENRNSDGDSETTARAMRAYHELNCEVGNLKEQIKDQLAEQKAQVNEASNFIKACRVMEQRLSKDIQAIRTQLEKYGYQAPCNTQRTTKTNDKDTESEAKVAEEDGTNVNIGKREIPEDDEGNGCSSPLKMQLPFNDVMRTPQLSDFGLSEVQLKRALAGAEWCSEVPPMPEMSLPQPSLNTPAPPPMPITPKCALKMDDDELQTPQMHDFGISEHTMCLNNDFTMDLFRKNAEKAQRAPQDIPVPTVDSAMENFQAKVDHLESPEPPVLCTPGFKIKKANRHESPQTQSNGDPETSCHVEYLSTTPEVPAFQTPYVNRLVSIKKSVRQSDPVSTHADDDDDDDSHTTDLQARPRNGTTGSTENWEYNVADLSVFCREDKQMPEMPNLESFLGNSLQNQRGKILCVGENEDLGKHGAINGLEMDGPTQEFSLGTPRLRTNYQEPSTPEMPDLSSITQDICKLVSQAQMKKMAAAAARPHAAMEDVHSLLPRPESLSVVTPSEFQTLPNYLRRMTLSCLNQAVSNINRFTEEHQGEKREFTMDDLRKMINVGTMAPVYVLCLEELKRLSHVDGDMESAVYKLITHS